LYRSLAPLKLREIVNEVRRKMTFEWLTQTHLEPNLYSLRRRDPEFVLPSV
jgi:hypothetical protein